MNDQQIKARAAKARVELTETDAAFDRMRQQAIDDLIKSKPSDAARREQLYHAINTIDTVREALRKAVRDGEHVDLIAELAAKAETAEA